MYIPLKSRMIRSNPIRKPPLYSLAVLFFLLVLDVPKARRLCVYLDLRRPFHLDAEEVAQKSFEQVIGNATEKQQEHRRPFNSVEEGPKEGRFADAVSEHCVAYG